MNRREQRRQQKEALDARRTRLVEEARSLFAYADRKPISELGQRSKALADSFGDLWDDYETYRLQGLRGREVRS